VKNGSTDDKEEANILDDNDKMPVAPRDKIPFGMNIKKAAYKVV